MQEGWGGGQATKGGDDFNGGRGLTRGRSTHYSNLIMIFLAPFPDVTRMSMSTVSFLAQSLEFSAYRMLSFDL